MGRPGTTPGPATAASQSLGGEATDLGAREQPSRAPSDAELATAVVARSVEAYNELFRRHHASIAAASRKILGSGLWAEDVVAEIFVVFWLTPERFDPTRGSFLGFMRLQARRRSIDVVRSESARRVREEGVRTTDDRGSSDDQLIAGESAASVHQALSLLPPLEREPIELAFFAGLSYLAVASRLNIPEGTIKSRIRNGLRRMSLNEMLQFDGGSALEWRDESFG
jgi:RNA polymerase sigma-70 factor (ECF subfamily)